MASVGRGRRASVVRKLAIVAGLWLLATSCGNDEGNGTSGGTTGRSSESATAPTTAGSATDVPASSDGGGDEEEPAAGGTIDMLDSGSLPATFDPALNPFSRVGPGAGTQSIAMFSVYDHLVRVDYNTNEVIPRIAEHLEANDAATVWTIELREGVTFSDGTPYDAEAVVNNWDRMKDKALGSRCLSTVSSFVSVATPDPLTVVVTLPAPAAGFPWLLAGCLSAVASPAAIAQFGESYGTSPETTVGAGAFVLSEFVAGDHATFERNPDFWDAPRPYLDGFTLRQPTTASQTIDALVTGTADISLLLNGTLATDLQRFLDESTIQKASYGPVAGAIAFAFNTNRAPLDDVRVRKALTLAFDPDDFNEKVAGGQLEMAETYLSEDSVFYNPDVAQPTGQLGEAQALIDEYVAEHGPIELTITNPSVTTAWNVVLQQQWNRLEGVHVELSVETENSASPKLLIGDYQIAAFNLGSHIDPESLFGRYHSQSSLNVLKFSDPTMDEWLTEYRGEQDTDRQKELLDQITKFLVMDQHWILQTFRPRTYVGANPKLHGITWADAQDIDLATLWLEP